MPIESKPLRSKDPVPWDGDRSDPWTSLPLRDKVTEAATRLRAAVERFSRLMRFGAGSGHPESARSSVSARSGELRKGELHGQLTLVIR